MKAEMIVINMIKKMIVRMMKIMSGENESNDVDDYGETRNINNDIGSEEVTNCSSDKSGKYKER